MSWSDDIRCLHCDGRLPLYRKITHGQFCSSAHRKAYWQEQERLAVERLNQTHDSLQAYRAPAPIELLHGRGAHALEPRALEPEDWQDSVPVSTPAALESTAVCPMSTRMELTPAAIGPAPATADPVLAGFVLDAPRAQGGTHHGVTGLGFIAYALEFEAEPLMTAEFAAQETGTPQTAERPLVVAGLVGLRLAQVRNVKGQSRQPEPVAPRTQAVRPEWSFAAAAGLHTAGAVKLSWAQPTDSDHARFATSGARRAAFSETGADPLPSATGLVLDVSFEVQPETTVLERRLERYAPLQERLYALNPGAPREARRTNPAGSLLDPLAAPSQPRLPLDGRSFDGITFDAILTPAALLEAGLSPLPVRENPRVHGIWVDSLRAVDFSQPGGPVSATLTTPPQAAHVRLAPGNGYRIEAAKDTASAAPAAGVGVTDLQIPPADLALPSAADPRSWGTTSRDTAWTPPSAAMLPLPVSAGSARPPVNVPHASATAAMYSLPQLSRIAPLLPHSSLEPLDAKPAADAFQPALPPPLGRAAEAQNTASLAGKSPFARGSGPFSKPAPRGVPVWAPVADFWKHAPRDLRMLVIAIPTLIALVFHPALPKVSVQAPKTTGIENVLGAQLASVRQTVLDRAAVALDEDFRSGLDGWTSRGNATAAWSFDATGFVQPGPLALYQPSMGLSDYQLQFLGMIDKKALSWVVRASDFENYYVIKLVVLKPGPLPLIGVTRYAVVNGKAVNRADTTVPVNARPDMLYRVRVDVHDEDFSLEVQGQMIDSWSEPRLRRGGIGFFSARGEESRVRWVQVTHQYDMLGRLCAYLAPYNIPTGSW